MLIHRLRLSAIGPFAGEHEIDVDRLTASGLFLLEGPTGAGKSTVIDAIVFALYGEVAGRASSTDRMHSDVADPTRTPWVELDFSTPHGLYRIRRSPKHARPKRRGEGTTVENASATLWRLLSPAAADGELGRPIATRLEEVGSEIARILGLSREQFIQTIVLPQGEFATFLRSDAERRRELLQRLFGTEVYDRVVVRLVDDRRRVRQELAGADSDVHGALLAFCAAAGLDDDRQSTLLELSEPDLAVALADELTSVATAYQEADAAAEAATHAAAEARTARDRARAAEQARLRMIELRAELAALDRKALEVDTHRHRLAAAEAAARLSPLLDGLMEAERRSADAISQLERVSAGLPESRVPSDLWPLREREVRDQAAELGVLLDLERRLPEAEAALARSQEARRDVERRRRAAEEMVALAPETIEALRRDLQSALTDQGRLSSAPADLASAADLLAVVGELERAQEKLAAAGAAQETARQAAQNAVAEESSLRSRYLDGIAGHLASELVTGLPCAVCGSTEHPAPASAQPGDVDRPAVEEAASRSAAAQSVLEGAIAETTSLTVAVSELRGRTSAKSVAQAQAEVRDAHRAVAAFDAATETVERLTTEIGAKEDELAGQRTAAQQLADESARLHVELDAVAAQLGDDRERVRWAAGEFSSVEARLVALRGEAERWGAAVETAEVVRAAVADLGTRKQEWEASLAGSSFDSPADVVAAQLCDPERFELQAEVERFDRRRTEIAVALADPWLSKVDVERSHDLDAADRAACEAEGAMSAAQQLRGQRRQRLEDGRLKAALVSAAVAERRRISEGAAAVIRMADLVSASTSDNARAMTLPTFVLRERFVDVVASANERLSVMSDGRYTLEHVEERSGGRRSGLGLQVRDTHTEQPRDPATLSGGETFYCSLALALGLADVVTAEAGGIDLGTLFVDEGFGSLDPETLEHVLGVLASLSASGRAVGIVSHVPELKERVHERVTISPNGDGSSRLTVIA